MGESSDTSLKLQFDRRVRLEFRGATITTDAGLLVCRELDDALGLTETATAFFRRAGAVETSNTSWCHCSGSRCTAALPATRTLTMLNGWPKTPPCESSLDGEAPRDKQQAPIP